MSRKTMKVVVYIMMISLLVSTLLAGISYF